MCDYRISRSKRIAASVMGIMMLVAVLFSVFFIAHEANHDCAGEGCPICACIEVCENTLHQIGGGAAAQAAVVLPAIYLFLSVCLPAVIMTQETPVSRKVRLNN